MKPGVLLESLLSLLAAGLAAALLLWAFGYDLALAGRSFVDGALANRYAIGQTLLRTVPLLFTGLAVALAFRVGLFNIGAEGQLYWGAFFSALVALHGQEQGWSPWLARSVALLAAALAGGIWGFIPGFLKVWRGAHEVIVTIMLNTIAILGTTYLTAGYFKEPGAIDQTARLSPQLRWPQWQGISTGIVLALAVVLVLHVLLQHTAWGYALQAVGYNPDAAAYSGIRSGRLLVLAMMGSGALAGVAGGMVVLAQLHRFISGFSPGYGFSGIAVAVLGRGNPWGVLLAALLFAALEAGGVTMQLFARIPSDVITVMQGLVILLVAAPSLWRFLRRRRLAV